MGRKSRRNLNRTNRGRVVVFPNSKTETFKFTQQLLARDFPPMTPEMVNGAMPEPEWCVAPFSVAKKTEPLEESNFDAFLDRLDDIDPNGRDWCVVTYNHWDVGDAQFVFFRPTETMFTHVEAITNEAMKCGMLDAALYEEYKAEAEKNKEP